MADVTATKTVAFRDGVSHSVTVTGTKPFKAVQAGGPSGAWDLVDANGNVTNPALDGQGSTSTFATQAKANLDAIVTAFNAA